MNEDKTLKYLTAAYGDLIGHRPCACVVTFGCQMNARDSEKLTGVLDQAGFLLSDSEKADFVIYNTCTVRENANTRVYGRLGQLKNYKKKNPSMIIALCGCMMQEKEVVETIRTKMRFVDLVFGTFNIDRFPDLLADILRRRVSDHNLRRDKPLIEVTETVSDRHESLPKVRKFPFRTGVNIMYGCDNYCSYCIVPYVRGPERSRKPSEIIDEITTLCDDGVREIMLLGQNVNSYGRKLDEPVTFAQLLDRIASQFPDLRLRFMTSHPKDLSDELIEVMASHNNICRHLHLPAQSGSDQVLKRMNRKYTRQAYLDLVRRLREAIPDISLTTDLIVGFPGETEEDAEATRTLVEEAGFDNAFTFLYSKRSKTPAAAYDDQIDPETAQARFDRLLETVHRTAMKRTERFTGTVQTVLVEETDRQREGWITGRLESNLIVHFAGDADRIGTFVKVRITENRGFYLIGEEASS